MKIMCMVFASVTFLARGSHASQPRAISFAEVLKQMQKKQACHHDTATEQDQIVSLWVETDLNYSRAMATDNAQDQKKFSAKKRENAALLGLMIKEENKFPPQFVNKVTRLLER